MSSALVQPTDKMCCVPLETGIKYWGWISIVINALSVIANFVLLVTYTETETVTPGGMVIVSDSILETRVFYGVLIGIALLSIGTSYMVVKAVEQVGASLLFGNGAELAFGAKHTILSIFLLLLSLAYRRCSESGNCCCRI